MLTQDYLSRQNIILHFEIRVIFPPGLACGCVFVQTCTPCSLVGHDGGQGRPRALRQHRLLKVNHHHPLRLLVLQHVGVPYVRVRYSVRVERPHRLDHPPLDLRFVRYFRLV